VGRSHGKRERNVKGWGWKTTVRMAITKSHLAIPGAFPLFLSPDITKSQLAIPGAFPLFLSPDITSCLF